MPATADQTAFLADLFGAGHLVDTGIPGVYGRGADFEAIRSGFDALCSRRFADEHAERIAFTPLLPRACMERTGYLHSFPHLAGTIFSFDGPETDAAAQAEAADHGEDWSRYQSMTDLVLTPAACHGVYPVVAARGPVPAGGVTIDTGAAYVYRHEPSLDPARLQMFHMRELIRVAEPDEVAAWRDSTRDRALALLCSIGLDASFDVASDPFFGRTGRLLARSQRQLSLKFEILVPIAGPEPTAVASFNYHRDHFAGAYGMVHADGRSEVHTACLGFGLERVTLALLRTHGLDVDGWPDGVRAEVLGA